MKRLAFPITIVVLLCAFLLITPTTFANNDSGTVDSGPIIALQATGTVTATETVTATGTPTATGTITATETATATGTVEATGTVAATGTAVATGTAATTSTVVAGTTPSAQATATAAVPTTMPQTGGDAGNGLLVPFLVVIGGLVLALGVLVQNRARRA